jgi:hypothetical protein
MLANLLPPGKPPEVLSEEARQIAAKLGYPDPPADSAYWFDLDPGYYRYSSRIAAPQRYHDLSSEFPYPQEFWYRQSPYPLRTDYPYAVTATNPAPFYSGEWRIGMDSAGRLNYFAAIALQENNVIHSDGGLDWQPLFAAADLNLQQSHEVDASSLPDVPSDKNYAWEIAAHGKTLRIQGASFRDKIVFFPGCGAMGALGARAATSSRLRFPVWFRLFRRCCVRLASDLFPVCAQKPQTAPRRPPWSNSYRRRDFHCPLFGSGSDHALHGRC